MSATRWTIAISLTVVPLVALAASPFGAGLKGSPFERFTDADFELFFNGAQQAAIAPLGDVNAWSNPKSGAHGTVTAVRNYKRDDGDCRELRGQNTARGRTEPFRLAICQQADGKWQLAPFEPPAKRAAPPAPTAPPAVPEAQHP